MTFNFQMLLYVALIDSSCSRQPPRRPPVTPTSWCSSSCILPPHPPECKLDLLICFQQIGYGRSNGISFPRWGYKKAVASILGIFSLLLLFSLVCFDGSQHCCELLFGEVRVAGNECLWPRASKYPRPVNEFGNSLPASSLVLTATLANFFIIACEIPWARDTQLRKPGLWTHRNCEVISVCCFKLLSFGILCYSAIRNTPT